MRINLLALLFLPALALAQIRSDSGVIAQPVTVGHGIRLRVPELQQETLAWQTAVRSNGGSFNATDTKAVDYFVTETKAKGLWSLVDRVNIFAGRNLNAALIPIKRTVGNAGADTNSNFVEGDFSPTVGLTGNGSSKKLDPGLNRSQCRAADNVSMGAYITANNGTGGTGRGIISSTTANQIQIFIDSSNANVVARANNGTSFSVAAGAGPTGFSAMSRITTDSASMVYSGTLSNSATQTPATGTGNIAIFAQDAANFWGGSLGGYWFGAGMTSQQINDFRAIWTQTMALLGRPTI